MNAWAQSSMTMTPCMRAIGTIRFISAGMPLSPRETPSASLAETDSTFGRNYSWTGLTSPHSPEVAGITTPTAQAATSVTETDFRGDCRRGLEFLFAALPKAEAMTIS